MLRAKKIDGQEGGHSQHQGNGYVACHITAGRENRDEAHQIIDEDEEEGSKQIGCKTPVVGTDTRLYHLVHQHRDEHFHYADKTAGGICRTTVPAIPPRYTQDQDDQDQTVHKKACCGLGN